MRISYYKKDKDSEPIVAKVSTIKKLIKEQGGFGWTEHYERDGGLFEVTEIELKGNNSHFKYNHHL